MEIEKLIHPLSLRKWPKLEWGRVEVGEGDLQGLEGEDVLRGGNPSQTGWLCWKRRVLRGGHGALVFCPSWLGQLWFGIRG